MSLIFTESWGNYPAFTGTDVNDAGNNNARTAYLDLFKQMGLTPYTISNLYGPVVRADPLIPSRRVLSQSNTTFHNDNTPIGGITFPLPASDKPLVVGFSFWMPAEFVPGPSSTVALLLVQLSGAEIFRVCRDALIRYSTNAAQSSRAPAPGKQSYLEFRYHKGEVRVWLDDVLVLQHSVIRALGTLTFTFSATGGGVAGAPGMVFGASGRFGIGNIYGLLEDGVAPNMRLGPTTRVLPIKPSSDALAQWLKPAGAASNAAVARADITFNPIDALQTETVGATDFYNGEPDAAIAGATLVHAVAIKAQASNLDTQRHKLQVLARVNVSEGDGSGQTASRLRPLRKFVTTDIYSAATLPDGSVFVGTVNDGRMGASDPRDLGSFSMNASIPANPTYIVGTAALSDGKVAAVSTSGTIYVGTPVGGGVFTWAAYATGQTAPTALRVSSDNTLYVIGSSRLVRYSTNGGVTWGTYVTIDGSGTSGIRGLAARGNRVLFSCTIANTSPLYIAGYVSGVHQAPSAVLLANTNVTIVNNHFPYPIAFSGDGSVVVCAGYIDATGVVHMWRSVDNGLNWARSATMTFGGVWSGLGFFTDVAWVSDGGGGGFFVAVGELGRLLVSNDGDTWTPISIGDTVRYNAIAPLPQGGFVAFGVGGAVITYSPPLIAEPLAPLGGWQKVEAVLNLNPETGLAWTGSEVAAAQFGMRLTA